MPYRTSPHLQAVPVTLSVSLAWGSDLLAVRHLLDADEAGIGDVACSLGPIPCDALGVAGFVFATLASGVGRVDVPGGAAATLCRTGGREAKVEGPLAIELCAGDACELVVGDFTLRASAEAREPGPQRLRAPKRPTLLMPILALVAALHGALLFVAPRFASRSADDKSGVNLAALRAILGGDKPGPGHDEEHAADGRRAHVEDAEPDWAKLPETEPAPPPPPAPRAKPPKRPARPSARPPADSHANYPEAAGGDEPSIGIKPTPPEEPDDTSTPPAPNQRSAPVAKKAGQRVFASEAGQGRTATGDEDPLLCFKSSELKPMPWVRFHLTFESGETRTGTADGYGGAILRGMKAPLRGTASWGRRAGDFEYTGKFVILGASRGETATEQRDIANGALGDLGFRDGSLEDRVRAFQAAEGHRVRPALAVTGQLEPRTWELLWKLHDHVCE